MHPIHQRQTSAATAARHARNLAAELRRALRGNSRLDADTRAIANCVLAWPPACQFTDFLDRDCY